MLTRLLSALIIIFWLATTGWLVRSVWFGSDTRFEPVAAEEALGAFFRWGEAANLTIIENGVRIGQMVVTGSEGEDRRTGEFTRSLSTQGSLDESAQNGIGSENLIGTSWRLTADFNEAIELKDFKLALRVPRQELDARLEFGGEPTALAARIMAGELVVFETGTLSADKRGRADISSAGADPDASSSTGPDGKAAVLGGVAGMFPGVAMMADPSAWKPNIEASRGVMEIGGSLQPVYLVKIHIGAEGESNNPVRLYLSEAGEPWRIDSGWGFEAIAEVLIPVEKLAR